MEPPTPPAAAGPGDEDAGSTSTIRLHRSLFGSDELVPEPEAPSSSGGGSDASDSSDDDFTEEGLRARDAVLSVAKSVVALAASVDGDPPSTFACTGTVVAREGPAAWIMTSAILIRKHDSGTEVHELSSVKIEVLLPNKKVAKGQLLMYDLHYNVAIVSVECEADLPVVVLADLPGSYFLTPTPVVAVARKFESGSLQVKRGETFRAVSELDCDELMVSTCQMEPQRENKHNSIQYITLIFIGGLLIDLDKRIVGINFIDENKTPFLPVQVVGRCLKHFRKFGRIKQPLLGIRGRALHMLELKDLEEICHKYRKLPSGILVGKIPEVSSANCGGIEAGDIFIQLDGVALHSPAQPDPLSNLTRPPAAREEMPPEEGEQQDLDKEAKAASVVFLLFGHGTHSEPEPKPKPACPTSPSSCSDDDDGESNSDDDDDFSAEGLRARDAALSVSRSVVSIAASTDGDPPSTFACTGTVVAHEGSATWIITSAALIRKPESDTEVHEPHAVKIEVLLHNKKAVKGRLLMYDLLYNVAIVSIARANLPAAMLNDLPDSYFLTPGPVVTVARKFESGRLQMKRGETLRAACELDCDELMVSTCQIEQIPEASSANCEGVEVGDILNQLDGVVLHSIAQLTSLLLDKMEVAMHERRPVILKALIQRPKDGATVAAELIVAERPPGECDTLLNNRWRLPPPTVYYWGPPDICDWADDDSD